MSLVEEIYRLSGSFPREEQFILTQQIRRAAVSVPSNIAEGRSRSSDREFLRYLAIASGSLAEIHTQLLIANRLQYAGITETDRLLVEIDTLGRMLRRLKQGIHRQNARAPTLTTHDPRLTTRARHHRAINATNLSNK